MVRTVVLASLMVVMSAVVLMTAVVLMVLLKLRETTQLGVRMVAMALLVVWSVELVLRVVVVAV